MLTIGNLSATQGISLYFHIPFCTRKCGYCHFYVLPDKEILKDELLEAFFLEWEQWLPSLQGKTITSIYFGGGTPFLFGPERIYQLLTKIQDTASFVPESTEITLEANPENVTLDTMIAYRQAGVNRVSLGIQTLDDELLKLLGRLHYGETALKAVYTTAEAGIKNISVDLMYDLPRQTLANWESTLEGIKPLPITHLSLYNLTIEPHTLFFKKQDFLKKELPNEEDSLAMYEGAIEVLEGYGLKQYEISAFAKEGFHSRHNTGYWIARPFLGFGPSAFSYWEGKRFRNIASLKKYGELLKLGQSPIDFEEELVSEAHIRELLVIQLRLKEGVHLQQFQKRHGLIDEELQKNMNSLIEQGYLTTHSSLVKLTKRGALFYDHVAAELI